MKCINILYGQNLNLKTNQRSSIAFGRQPCFCSKSILCEDNVDFKHIKHQTTIKDLEGNEIKAIIIEEPYDDNTGFFGSDPKKFTLFADNKKLAYAISYNGDKKYGGMFVKELFGEENYQRHYKGIGTELLKCLVKESKKQGNKGKIFLNASHIPAPFVFYYKNNFQVSGNRTKQHNATIDYAARNNIPISSLLPNWFSSLSMVLDEKGANALLKGERLYEKREFHTIEKFDYKGRQYEVNLVQSPDLQEYNFQIVTPETKEFIGTYSARLKDKTDEEEKKVLVFYNVMDDLYLPRKNIEQTIQNTATALGYDYAVISDECVFNE